ncbi:hypothetical protein HDU86_006778 [Geranomyces michiganensis]|nr:hypothetical protein HDU86_006778 [Geranomyces michiganensis]
MSAQPPPPPPPPTSAPQTHPEASSSAGQTQSISYIAPILGICSVLGLFAILTAFFLWRRHVRSRPGYSQRSFQRKHGFSVVACHIRRMWGVTPEDAHQHHGDENNDSDDHDGNKRSDELTTPPAAAPSHPVYHHSAKHSAIDTSLPPPEMTSLAAGRRAHSGPSSPSSPRSARKSPSQLPLVNTTSHHRLSANSLTSLGSPPSPIIPATVHHRPAGPCFRPSSEMLPTRLCKTYVWQQEPSPLAYDHDADDDDDDGHEDLAIPSSSSSSRPAEEVRSAKSIRMGWDEDEMLV